MDELIQQLQTKAGLTAEQAHISLQTIKQFVVEKFPMLSGAVDNIFPTTPLTTATNATTATTAAMPTTPVTSLSSDAATTNTSSAAVSGSHATAQEHHESSFMDKISDYIPGQAGEKIEDFVKKAAHSADNLFNKK